MKQILAISFLVFSAITFNSSQALSAQKPVVNLVELQKTSWTSQEQENVKVIADFVQNLMNNHDFDYVMRVYNNSRYVQHNRNLPDSIEGLVGFLKDFVGDYPEYSYDVKHIYADGDFVIFHSHATLKAEHRGNDQYGMNIIDKWRIQDGQIVEHWDSIQALDGFMRFYSLLSGGAILNDNGLF